MKNKKKKKEKYTFDLRLEFDRFFDKMRNPDEYKEFNGVIHSYQNTSNLISDLLKKANEDYVITKEPKRFFIFENTLRETGIRIYFNFQKENDFVVFKEKLFESFKEHLFIKIKKENNDSFIGYALLTNLNKKDIAK